ncbi:MAG: MFS transporter [Rhodocyclaceae bacterium]|nr:MFS transporter [Rhodocyclaceae bacterium]MBP6108642.1 MFS transporter [Rhodocyclaceae bacterium]MBP6278472.1 MFS transporter [Rhodocyclaceae bacterium]
MYWPHWQLSLWYFVYFAFVGAYMPYFSLYLEAQNLAPNRIAVLMTLGQLVRLLMPMVWGWVSDSIGRRTPIIRASAALSTMVFVGYFFTQDFILLVVVTALLHFFWCASLPLVEALTFSHLRHEPNFYGRIRVWGSIGFVVAVFCVGWWLDRHPISSLLGILWATLALTLVAAFVIRDAPTAPAIQVDEAIPSLRQSKVIALMLVGFLMSAAHGALYVFYSIHLAAHGYDNMAIGLLWSLGVIAEILVFIRMPRLANLDTLEKVLMACLALAVVRFLVIGWYADTVLLLIAAQVLHGATFGAHHVASVAALNQWFLPRQQGRIQSLYGGLSFGGGGLLGGLIAGQTWMGLGAEISFTISAAFALAGLLVVHSAFSTKATSSEALR